MVDAAIAFLNLDSVKKTFISPAIYSNLTPLVTNIGPAISPLITSALRKLDDKILTVVSNGPSPDPTVPDGKNLVNWNNAGRVEGIMKSFNNFLSHHMSGNDSPGILTCGAKDRGGLDGLIDRFTSHGTIHKGFSNANTTFTIPGYAQLTLGVKYLNVSGLDTITDLTILEPTGDHSLTTGIAASSFNASVGVFIIVDPIPGGAVQGGSLSESFDLGLSLGDLQLFAKLFLGVDSDSLSALTVYQIIGPNAYAFHPHQVVDWPCAFSTLWSAAVTDLKTLLNLKDVYLHADPSLDAGSLEAELDKLIDDTLSLFVGDYNELVTDSLAGIVQGPVRDLVNKLIEEGIEDIESVVVDEEPCAEPLDMNVTEPEYFHFDESKVRRRGTDSFFYLSSGRGEQR